MAIGALNPRDVSHTTTTRPAATLNAVNQRRWFSDALGTEVTDQDLNGILAQIRYAMDFYTVPDVEGADDGLQKAIAAGAANLSGNLKLFQQLVGGPDKVPYFTSNVAMSLMTVTSFSRDLLSKTNLTQWQAALGIGAAASPNVIALGNLASAADKLPYFTGPGAMSMVDMNSYGRSLVSSVDAISARSTLGLGSSATQPSTAFATPADLLLKADLASPALTGTPTAPTQATADNSTRLATTAYVKANIAGLGISNISGLQAALDLKAPLASPSFTGVPTAPTQTAGDSSTRIATTAFVGTALSAYQTIAGMASFAPLASPAFTGSPTAPTPTPGDSSTKIATTAWVAGAITAATLPDGDKGEITVSSSATVWTIDPGVITAEKMAFNEGGNLVLNPSFVTSIPAFAASLHSWMTSSAAGWTAVLRSAGGTPMSTCPALGALSMPPDAAVNKSIFVGSSTVAHYTGVQGGEKIWVSCYAAIGAGTVTSGALRLGLWITHADGSTGSSAVATITPTTTWQRFESQITLPSTAAYIVPYMQRFLSADTATIYVTLVTAEKYLTAARISSNFTFDSNGKLDFAQPYVPLGGGTMTGGLTTTSLTVNAGGITLDRAGDAAAAFIDIRRDAGQLGYIVFRTGLSNRWLMFTTTTAESGADVGSDMALQTYADDGTTVRSVWQINRATRVMNFTQIPTFSTATLGDNTTQGATTAFVQANALNKNNGGTVTGPVTISNGGFLVTRVGEAQDVSVDMRADAGKNAVIYGRKGTTARWGLFLGSSTAESGSNAGSDFWLFRYNDAGVGIDVPFQIIRASGAAQFLGSVTVKNSIFLDRVGAAASASIVLARDAGQVGDIIWRNSLATDNRWLMRVSADAETGGSAGSVFQLWRYNDVGTAALTLSISRVTNVVAFSQSPTAPTPTAGDATTQLATTAFVDASFLKKTGGTITGNLTQEGDANFTGGYLQLSRVGEAAGAFYYISADAGQPKSIVFRTGSSNRFQFYVTGAVESGANVGSDMQLIAYSDAGASLGSVYTITRATRVFAFSVPPTSPTPSVGDNSTQSATTAFVTRDFAALVGATFTGTLIVSIPAAPSQFQIRGDAGQVRDIRFMTGTVLRWLMRINATAESGSNAGSDFQLFSYDDAGVSLGTVLTITRSTQIANFGQSPTAPTPVAGDNTTKLATTSFVASGFLSKATGGTVSGSTIIDANFTTTGQLTIDKTGAGTASSILAVRGNAGSIRDVEWQTGTQNRWAARANATLEAGSNAGSDFQLIAYNDAGTFLSTAFTITRSTNIVAFGASPTAPTPATADSSTQLATTAFVKNQAYAPIASPTFTGNLGGVNANFSGTLTVSSAINLDHTGIASSAYISVIRDAGQFCGIILKTGSTNRLLFGLTNAAESGSDAGSVVFMQAYADDGTTVRSLFSASRATGIMAFAQTPTAPSAPTYDDTTKVATTAYVADRVLLPAASSSITAAFTLDLVNLSQTNILSSASAMNVTVPPTSSVSWPIGATIAFITIGAGQITIVAGAGVTVTSRNGLKSAGQYAVFFLYRRTGEIWVAWGDLIP